jgi:hypothetical protein
LFLVTLAVLVYRARPLFLNVDDLSTTIVSTVITLAGVAVVIVSVTSGWRSAPGLLAFAAAVTFAVLPYGVVSAAQNSAVVQMAAHVREAHEGSDVAIGTYKVFVRNLVFYSGLKHTDIIHDEHLHDWLSKNPRALVVMSAGDADRLAAGGLVMTRLAALPYFNEGGIKVRMLLWPDATTDLETVVLVRIDRPPTTSSRG